MSMPHSRKAFLTEPGQQLLSFAGPNDVIELLDERPVAWAHLTGLDEKQVMTNPLLTIPLPLYVSHRNPYDPAVATDPRVYFPDVKPEALWHPLFWLPSRLADIRSVNVTSPNDDEWACRVAIQMVATGMYDPTSGTWYDVLAAYGLDVNDPADLARITAWQRGGADPILDTIDLDDEFRPEGTDVPLNWDQELLVEAAYNAHVADFTSGLARPAMWGRFARDLYTDYNPFREPNIGVDDETLAEYVGALIQVGLRSVAEARHPGDGAPRITEWAMADVSLTPGMSAEEIQAGPLAMACDLLHSTALQYEQAMNAGRDFVELLEEM
ncbi:hypothetical protein V5R04_06965 [Jonesiaceae bacterium BS-20]|uniref:Uncharacterized protein n=1 Tax=Jonesiaceae bacterium BS-20 TaxID=3120821 RepID=A0AAU7DZJ9_9MICO